MELKTIWWWYYTFTMKSYYMTFSFLLLSITNFGKFLSPPPLCVQMDFTQTFQTKTKCNKINHVCSYFYKILVVLKYHRCLWANIFDTDINRCINTYIKVVYLAFFGIFMLLQMYVSKILAHRHLWYFKSTKILQKWLQTWFILLHLVFFGIFMLLQMSVSKVLAQGRLWYFKTTKI